MASWDWAAPSDEFPAKDCLGTLPFPPNIYELEKRVLKLGKLDCPVNIWADRLEGGPNNEPDGPRASLPPEKRLLKLAGVLFGGLLLLIYGCPNIDNSQIIINER